MNFRSGIVLGTPSPARPDSNDQLSVEPDNEPAIFFEWRVGAEEHLEHAGQAVPAEKK